MMTTIEVGEFLRTLTNPRYATEDKNGAIALDGTYNGQTLIFYASPIDAMDYGRNIYKRAIDGNFGAIKEYEPIEEPKIIEPETKPQLDLFAEVSK
jgi:hypothetical protein